MHCPHCQVEMVPASKQGVLIDVCPRCRGIWLDRGELEKIMERVAQSVVDYDQLAGHDYSGHITTNTAPGAGQIPPYQPNKPAYGHDPYGYGHGYKHKKKKHGVLKLLEEIFD
ncbi:zf-TFIIB domain-containing protein [Desulfurispora thermophila]|uniref:TFIIB-type zinc ribbon-containing protein n=1 Tax=Desulfurispora thermophila TaxID=265470 RepID=UPI0003A266ED|nr:zf-TFIIB domain-containing protein [Desulfurispora thermophila]